MKLGIVTGRIWSTVKVYTVDGFKFLKVQIRDNLDTRTVIAADTLDAGIGDTVILTGGSSARMHGADNLPIDSMIIGIVDKEKAGSLINEKN